MIWSKQGAFQKVDILTHIHPSWAEYNFWAEQIPNWFDRLAAYGIVPVLCRH